MAEHFDVRKTRRRGRYTWLALAAALVMLVGGGLLGWRAIAGAGDDARQAAEAFARAWSAESAGRLAQVDYASTSGKKVAGAYRKATEDLRAGGVDVRTEDVSVEGDTGQAELSVAWDFPGRATWRYHTTAGLLRDGGVWKVRWSPSVVHPRLKQGGRLVAEREQPERAPIRGRNGRALVTERPVVNVGVVPGKVPDAAALADSLRDVLDIEADGLAGRITDASDDVFVKVITLRQKDFAPLEGRLRALPGVTWSEESLPLAPTREFASALLGRVGTVTAEVIKGSQGRYRAGDIAGLSGMQRRYDKRLAGEAGLRVLVVPPDGGGQSREPVQLFRNKPVPGQAVRTTLDPDVQRAADTALAGVQENSALVAVHVPSGEVLAVAHGPEAGGYNRALRGRYPPGSTFKVVSTLALLRGGLSLDETVRCPEYARVDGKSWHNFNNFELGAVPFRTDFAKSCNTAFIGLAPRLDSRALTGAGATLGLGRPYHLGVPAFSGNVPATTSRIDHAAAMIGQARVLASPLSMATVAATVARGEYVPPSLVVEPKPSPAGRAQATRAAKAQAEPLRKEHAQAIRGLMRKVVTSGSGTAVADVPGGPVIAKTGTAEYGTADPPKTHVWMIGFHGDIAFSVFVENGESGGQVAGPIAADFLKGLHSRRSS